MKTLVLSGAAVLVLALVPLVIQSPYSLHIFILVFMAVALGESWNVIGGFAGQYSVGHAAWYGIGAYGAFILLQSKGIAPWKGVWPAVAIAVLIGVAESVSAVYFGSGWKDVCVYVIFLLVLLLKPSGLLGKSRM